MTDYVKEFFPEYRRLIEDGMTEEQVEAFYPLWLEINRSDKRFENNTWRFGVGTTGSVIDGSVMIPWRYDGTQARCRQYREQSKQSEEQLDTSWASLNPKKHDISVRDTDRFDREELSEELYMLLKSMPELDTLIVDLLTIGMQKQEVAQQLGISRKTVSKHMEPIRETLRPYFVKHHMLVDPQAA